VKGAVGAVLIGVSFGYALLRMGFSSWDEVHAMFTFTSFRLTLGFALAVALLSVGWVIVARLRSGVALERRIHPGTIPGGIVFGIGWALSGACPSIAMVQLGEGQFGAIYTLAGVFVGNYVYARVHERYFRWAAASCAE
jgi:hypothetical protein